MKQPFPYHGGKGRLARRIVEIMPPHAVYVEPFCGSAAVMFKKGTPPVTNGDHYREVINDTNCAVVDFFRAARADPDGLARKIQAMPYAQIEHARALAVYHGVESEADPLERAALFYLLLCGSGAFGIGGTQTSGRCSESQAQTWRNRQGRIGHVLNRLSGVHVQSMDAVDLIEKWDSPQTFFYVDPPYVGTSCGHYSGYGADDQAALLRALDGAQGSFVLSGYADSAIDAQARASGWSRLSHDASCSIAMGAGGARRGRKEVLWCRGRTTEPTGAALRALRAVEATCYFKGIGASR